jgi:hypothetical protein
MEFISVVASGATVSSAFVKVGNFLTKQTTNYRVDSGDLNLSASMAILDEAKSILCQVELKSLLLRYDQWVLLCINIVSGKIILSQIGRLELDFQRKTGNPTEQESTQIQTRNRFTLERHKSKKFDISCMIALLDIVHTESFGCCQEATFIYYRCCCLRKHSSTRYL